MAQESQENETTERNDNQKSKSSDSSSRSRSRSSSSQSRRRSSSRGRGGYRRSRYHSRRKVCLYCADKEKVINWKNLDDLRRFIGDNGAIFPRRKTGLCAKHQRGVAQAIKRARHIALLPYTGEHVRIMGQRR